MNIFCLGNDLFSIFVPQLTINPIKSSIMTTTTQKTIETGAVVKNMETDLQKFQNENNIYSFQKLTKKEVILALEWGAILSKNYGVYSYWDLTFADGSRSSNIRSGATNIDRNLLVEVARDKNGYSYKIKK